MSEDYHLHNEANLTANFKTTHVLDELTLWHMEHGLKDFSLLEVNRYMLYLLLPHVEIY